MEWLFGDEFWIFIPAETEVEFHDKLAEWSKEVENLKREKGLSGEIFIHYFRWMGDFFTGDWGESFWGSSYYE